MKKISFFILLLSFALWSCQNIATSKEGQKLLGNMKLLDIYLQNNDEKIVDILSPDVSFGHSNGWIQNFEDFKKDFSSKKVTYKEIQQTELSEIKKYKNTVSIRRKIKVSGTYKNQDFEMKLALLEIWIRKNTVWKLWSRQSVEIKP
ncbi:nuclear transport factor 2 family protein [Chryseobacterium sp. RP-3-3]|uniref:Nuclear transport factor 2 family protein n=1 Tax=Chryseobacterium antibioticum TaxID=2728847 RepID=A0A7Y0AKA0_9FLAO|nr:nuclear transport factor 2 family protein [Chryseobacterium antibioticum]NML68876.1 nuclear transport factor 2 family protein [Chryseobacterium antibioticum]